jgi:signal peptidase I
MLRTERAPRRRWIPALVISVFLVVAGAATLAVVSVATGTSDLRYGAESMGDTIPEGSTVEYEQVPAASLRRGDIVVVDDASWLSPDMTPNLVIRRVIGIGGDTVDCCDPQGRIEVDGKAITENYLATHPAQPTQVHLPFPSVTVPAGEFFLAGDDRSNSVDSRVMLRATGKPTVPASAIKGLVVASGDGVRFTHVAATTAFTDAGLPGAPTPVTDPGASPAITVTALVVTAVGGLGLLTLGIIAIVRRQRRQT